MLAARRTRSRISGAGPFAFRPPPGRATSPPSRRLVQRVPLFGSTRGPRPLRMTPEIPVAGSGPFAPRHRRLDPGISDVARVPRSRVPRGSGTRRRKSFSGMDEWTRRADDTWGRRTRVELGFSTKSERGFGPRVAKASWALRVGVPTKETRPRGSASIDLARLFS